MNPKKIKSIKLFEFNYFTSTTKTDFKNIADEQLHLTN